MFGEPRRTETSTGGVRLKEEGYPFYVTGSEVPGTSNSRVSSLEEGGSQVDSLETLLILTWESRWCTLTEEWCFH